MRLPLILAIAACPLPALAQGADGNPDLIFSLRGGASVQPDYFGSSDYSLGPDVALRFGYLRLGGREFGSPDPDFEPRGFGLRGSFRYIGERSEDDSPELEGLDDVDAAVEMGLGLGYTTQNFKAFADVRYGVIGHESLVGELGADLVARPNDRLTLTAGPRVLIGSDDYASTYFGVSASEAAQSTFGAYDAEGGIMSTGIELGATYEVNDNWAVEGAVTWDRLQNDAADSPIVEAGERDQYGVRIGVTRRITLDF